MITFTNESSLVLDNGTDTIIDLQKGEIFCVEFDFIKVREYINKNKTIPVFLHFIHVHPISYRTYSSVDKNCLQGFTMAFGFPVLFSIICFDNNDVFNIDCEIFFYMYIGKEMILIDNYKYKEGEKLNFMNWVHLKILKQLSYNEEINYDVRH